MPLTARGVRLTARGVRLTARGVRVNGYGVVVLAGGAGRRLGGPAKPTLPVAGQPMLVRVLAAVGDAADRVVVGPASLGALVPPGVRVVQEEPAGGGPVAALAAGLGALTAGLEAGLGTGLGAGLEAGLEAGGSFPVGAVLVLAADLPLLTRQAVHDLLAALGDHDGAVFVDDGGRRQWLCGAWSGGVLGRRLRELAGTGPLGGRSMRELVAPLRVVEVPVGAGGRPPWYDCDTPADLADAERRLT